MLACILACFGLVYLGFPSYDYYFDGLTFAMAAEGVADGGDPAWLLHPHHLLYGPGAYVLYRAAHALGLTVRAWFLMQVAAAVFAVAALAAFHELARKLGLRAGAAAAATVLLGATYNFWHFASQGETTMPATLCLLALMTEAFVVVAHTASKAAPGSGEARPLRAAGALYLGLLQGGAILIHQTAAVFLPAGIYAVSRGSRRKGRTAAALGRAATLIYAGCAVAVALAAYASAAVFILHVRSPGEAVNWMLGYLSADPRTGYRIAYESSSPIAFLIAAKAWIVSLIGYWPHALAPWGLLWFPAAGFLAAGVLLGAARACLAAIRGHSREDKGCGEGRSVIALVVFVAAHALFFTWWKPGHARFWLLAQPAWIALAALGAAKGLKVGRRRIPGSNLLWALAALAVIVTGTGAFRREISPDCNPCLAIASALEERTDPGATIVISGVGTYGALKAYVPYFARRRMLILDWQFKDKGIPPAQALETLRRGISGLKSSGPVYALSEAAGPALDGHFESIHRVSGADLRRMLDSFHPEPIAVIAPGLSLSRL